MVVEYAFTNNLSAKIEGLYVNLDQDDNFPGLDLDNDAEFGVVRAGLNFQLRHLLRSVSPETDEKARVTPRAFLFLRAKADAADGARA